MARLSRDQMLIEMAYVASLRSTCNRLRVGSVIAVDSRPISLGYNGSPPGLPHCGGECNEQSPCKNTLHAEFNAISWCVNHEGGVPKGATMYVTHVPCPICSLLIIGAGIKRLVYSENYRDMSYIDHMTDSGIEVTQCLGKIVASAI